ncbi:MAG: hypothetical protein U1E10_10190 [Bdellovibrionales bacterium]|nr:hypothetical protein [Bdellovibrionales bacterium]
MNTVKSLAPMSKEEVEDLGRELSTWVGAQLQEVLVDGRALEDGGHEPKSIRLGFFWSGGIRWLVFDYLLQAPVVVLFDGQDGVPMSPPKPSKIRRPIELFLRSAFVGKRLMDVSVTSGRTLVLKFQSEPAGARLEFKLDPHSRNLTAVFFEDVRGKIKEKQLSEFKPVSGEGNFRQSAVPSSGDSGAGGARSRSQLALDWLERNLRPKVQNTKAAGLAGPGDSTKTPRDLDREKVIAKRRKALEKVRAEVLQKETSPSREIGEWLKEAQSLDSKPLNGNPEWESYIDRRKSFSANLEHLFKVAKSHERKLDGTKARARELELEIEKLESGQADVKGRREARDLSHSTSATAGRDLFSQAGARGRKVEIAADLILYIGKNGAENLAILRKAQPFDYWMHIKDQPGAHGIIRRSRGREVSDSEFSKAGIALLEQSMKRRAIEMKGEAYDVLIVECRFVRPIKGDRLGRVQYTNDRVLRIRC